MIHRNRDMWRDATQAFVAMTLFPALIGPSWFAATTALIGAVCAVLAVIA
jgi:hypothetical protein